MSRCRPSSASTSATEQEIWRGARGAPNGRQHVLAFIREIENVGECQPVEIRDLVDVDESGAINAVSQSALRELKQELRNRLGEAHQFAIQTGPSGVFLRFPEETTQLFQEAAIGRMGAHHLVAAGFEKRGLPSLFPQ